MKRRNFGLVWLETHPVVGAAAAAPATAARGARELKVGDTVAMAKC